MLLSGNGSNAPSRLVYIDDSSPLKANQDVQHQHNVNLRLLVLHLDPILLRSTLLLLSTRKYTHGPHPHLQQQLQQFQHISAIRADLECSVHNSSASQRFQNQYIRPLPMNCVNGMTVLFRRVIVWEAGRSSTTFVSRLRSANIPSKHS